MFYWNQVPADCLRQIYGKEPKPDLMDHLKVMTLHQGCDWVRQEYGLSAGADEIRDGINALMKQFYTQRVRVKDGARSWLEQLHKQDVPMVIGHLHRPAAGGSGAGIHRPGPLFLRRLHLHRGRAQAKPSPMCMKQPALSSARPKPRPGCLRTRSLPCAPPRPPVFYSRQCMTPPKPHSSMEIQAL